VRVIQPSFEIIDHNDLLRNIELGGRVCYKSEDKMCPGSDEALIARLMNMKHESVLEHGVITVKFVTDRGVSHELVRHRLAAYSQESTRYCNYGKEKFGNEITVIDPFEAFPNSSPECRAVWQIGMNFAEETYFAMLEAGASPQEARSVLPNSTKTEVQMTANVREWRHVLRLRTHRDAHPQIRQIMIPLGDEFAKRWPVLFGDFAVQQETKNDN
jgi:thymidylate synthase (FAD)